MNGRMLSGAVGGDWFNVKTTISSCAANCSMRSSHKTSTSVVLVMSSQIITLALDEPTLSPRELAVRFTETENYFVSEASVYRLLKAHDLIASPAFIVMKAADEFKDKTRSGAEPEIRNRQIVLRADLEGHSSGDAQAIFGRGEDSHRAGRPCAGSTASVLPPGAIPLEPRPVFDHSSRLRRRGPPQLWSEQAVSLARLGISA